MFNFIAKKMCNSAEKKASPEQIEKIRENYIEEIKHNQERIRKVDRFLALGINDVIEAMRDAKSLYEIVYTRTQAQNYIKKQGYEYFEIKK